MDEAKTQLHGELRSRLIRCLPTYHRICRIGVVKDSWLDIHVIIVRTNY